MGVAASAGPTSKSSMMLSRCDASAAVRPGPLSAALGRATAALSIATDHRAVLRQAFAHLGGHETRSVTGQESAGPGRRRRRQHQLLYWVDGQRVRGGSPLGSVVVAQSHGFVDQRGQVGWRMGLLEVLHDLG